MPRASPSSSRSPSTRRLRAPCCSRCGRRHSASLAFRCRSSGSRRCTTSSPNDTSFYSVVRFGGRSSGARSALPGSVNRQTPGVGDLDLVRRSADRSAQAAPLASAPRRRGARPGVVDHPRRPDLRRAPHEGDRALAQRLDDGERVVWNARPPRSIFRIDHRPRATSARSCFSLMLFAVFARMLWRIVVNYRMLAAAGLPEESSAAAAALLIGEGLALAIVLASAAYFFYAAVIAPARKLEQTRYLITNQRVSDPARPRGAASRSLSHRRRHSGAGGQGTDGRLSRTGWSAGTRPRGERGLRRYGTRSGAPARVRVRRGCGERQSDPARRAAAAPGRRLSPAIRVSHHRAYRSTCSIHLSPAGRAPAR